MGNLFGKKKVSRVTEHDKAVLQVKQQRDKLKQYQQRIEGKLENERQMAIKLVSEKQIERAKLLLRKKKYQEQLLMKTDGQLENIERLIHDLEFSQIEMQVLDGLKVGNEALKKMNALLNIDEIERIMEETQEGVDKQREITDMLSGALTAEDEEDVEKEYEEMMRKERQEEEMEEEDVELPEVPQDELPSRSKEKEKGQKTKKIALEAS